MTAYTLIPMMTGICGWVAGYAWRGEQVREYRTAYFDLLEQAIEDHRALRSHKGNSAGTQGEQ